MAKILIAIAATYGTYIFCEKMKLNESNLDILGTQIPIHLMVLAGILYISLSMKFAKWWPGAQHTEHPISRLWLDISGCCDTVWYRSNSKGIKMKIIVKTMALCLLSGSIMIIVSGIEPQEVHDAHTKTKHVKKQPLQNNSSYFNNSDKKNMLEDKRWLHYQKQINT